MKQRTYLIGNNLANIHYTTRIVYMFVNSLLLFFFNEKVKHLSNHEATEFEFSQMLSTGNQQPRDCMIVFQHHESTKYFP